MSMVSTFKLSTERFYRLLDRAAYLGSPTNGFVIEGWHYTTVNADKDGNDSTELCIQARYKGGRSRCFYFEYDLMAEVITVSKMGNTLAIDLGVPSNVSICIEQYEAGNASIARDMFCCTNMVILPQLILDEDILSAICYPVV